MNTATLNLKKTIWSKYIEKKFFKDIYTPNRYDVKNYFLTWIFYLKEFKNISINSAASLFNQCKEISFPVEVLVSEPRYLELIDSNGESIYINYNYDINTLDTFTVRSQNSPYNKTFTYRIIDNDTILLDNYSMLILTDDNSSRSFEVNVSYDYNRGKTTINYKHNLFSISISYQCIDTNTEDLIINHLISNRNKGYYFYNNVAPLFISIVNSIDKDLFSLSFCSRKGTQILSQIQAFITSSECIVSDYSFTKIHDQVKTSFITLETSKSLKEFIEEFGQ